MSYNREILTIPTVHQHELYLGLPTVSMKSKRLQFNYLVERVGQRIQGWSNKCFSAGGKEVMIRSVLQAIPTYAMSCFKLPNMVCEDIEKECANFWWGLDNGKRKLHWKSWDFLCQPKSRGGLGFRKVSEFNRALLAKQLWRLIRFPDSLVAKVLKGRYYRHETVLKAELGSNPSYIWRSILWSKEILMRGLVWRVGDGKSINIFEEHWIPTIQSKINKPLVPWEINATVDNLIKDGAWDADLLYSSFNPYIAGEILKIPLPITAKYDDLYWRFDAKGKYSVRDGCRLQRGLFDPPVHQSTHPFEDWWSFIWSLSVPPKVRLFWWSISHDCIPTNLNLNRQHVPVRESCMMCNFPMDSSSHALFFCPALKVLWKNSPFQHVLRAASRTTTMEICLWLKEQMTKNEFEYLAIHTWAIWKEKQKFLHGDKRKPMIKNIPWSSAMLSEFQKARLMETIACPLERGSPAKTWKPPSSSNLKLNVDAAVNGDQNQYSVGGVVRDTQGRLLLAFGKQINQPISVVHGELLAIREGIKLLYDNCFQDVQVASDSLLAVQAVTNKQEYLGYIGFCTTEIIENMKAPMVSEIIHERRSANKVAHHIARFSLSSHSSFVWVNGEFPSWLVKLVIDDCLQ